MAALLDAGDEQEPMDTGGGHVPLDTHVDAAYDQLRVIAARIVAHTPADGSNPTSLVHEAYLNLRRNDDLTFTDKTHFLRVASTAMRRLLVDRYRRRAAQKRGGGRMHDPIVEPLARVPELEHDLLDLDTALDELALTERLRCEIVELRYFGGCTLEQAAAVVGLSVAKVHREWEQAKAWLYARLTRDAAARVDTRPGSMERDPRAPRDRAPPRA